jgi:hypothetical protein
VGVGARAPHFLDGEGVDTCTVPVRLDALPPAPGTPGPEAPPGGDTNGRWPGSGGDDACSLVRVGILESGGPCGRRKGSEVVQVVGDDRQVGVYRSDTSSCPSIVHPTCVVATIRTGRYYGHHGDHSDHRGEGPDR